VRQSKEKRPGLSDLTSSCRGRKKGKMEEAVEKDRLVFKEAQ